MEDPKILSVSLSLSFFSCLPVSLSLIRRSPHPSPVSAMSSPVVLHGRLHQQETEVSREVHQVVRRPHEQEAPPKSVRDAPAELTVRKRISDFVLELACIVFIFLYCRRMKINEPMNP